jgi:hypothetical protein
VRFDTRAPGGSYWEAEIPLPGSRHRMSVTMTGTPEKPTEAEVAFCMSVAANLDGVFARCRDTLAPAYLKACGSPMPADWRGTFRPEGLQVPVGGNDSKAWEICYFAEPPGRWFIARFDDGKIVDVQMDS